MGKGAWGYGPQGRAPHGSIPMSTHRKALALQGSMGPHAPPHGAPGEGGMGKFFLSNEEQREEGERSSVPLVDGAEGGSSRRLTRGRLEIAYGPAMALNEG